MIGQTSSEDGSTSLFTSTETHLSNNNERSSLLRLQQQQSNSGNINNRFYQSTVTLEGGEYLVDDGSRSRPILSRHVTASESISSSHDGSSNDLRHCHTSKTSSDTLNKVSDPAAKRALILATILCLLFMIAEIVGGAIAGSLAIMTDAAHLLTDVASFLISLFSLYVAARPPTRQMPFGFHRAEVLGALFSVLFIWIVTGVLVYIAIERIVSGEYEINATVMLLTAGVGVGVNIIMAIVLHYGSGGHHGHSHGGASGHSHSSKLVKPAGNSMESHAATGALPSSSSCPGFLYPRCEDHNSHEDNNMSPGSKDTPKQQTVHNSVSMHQTTSAQRDDPESANNSRTRVVTKRKRNINVRAAMIHVIGDFFQSVGVFCAALFIYIKPSYAIADPICTFLFSGIVLITTLTVLRDALTVLMEGKPHGMDFQEVQASLLAIEGVKKVHNLRIWSLTMDKVALAVHLAIEDTTLSQAILKEACDMLTQEFGIYECTVQIEVYSYDMDECRKCEFPAK